MAVELVVSKKALGVSGTEINSGVYTEEYLIELQGFEAAQIFNRMRRGDSQIRKILAAILNPIKAAVWGIPPVSEEKLDVEVAALMSQIIFKDIPWQKFLHEWSTMVPQGYSMFEPVHINKTSKEFGDYTTLAQLAFRSQTTITEWHHNVDTGELESVKQEANSDIQKSVTIPRKNLLIFYNEQEGDNNGMSILRALYGPWKRKLMALEIGYIGLERFGTPTPKVKVPSKIKTSSQEYKDAKAEIEAYVTAEDAALFFPEGWEVTLEHNNVFDPTKIKDMIKMENEEMAGAVVATFLELGMGGNGGAYALSNDISDFFLKVIESFPNQLIDTINRELIPHLGRLNFGDKVAIWPELTYSGISDKAGKETMEVLTGYTNAGVVTKDPMLEDHVREANGYPKKVEGSTDNQNAGGDNGDNDRNGGNAKNTDGSADANSDNNLDTEEINDGDKKILKLAVGDEVEHIHIDSNGNETGIGIEVDGGDHVHALLDEDGNSIGQDTLPAETGVPHTHVEPDGGETGDTVDLSDHIKKKKKKKLSDNIKFAEAKTTRALINQEAIKISEVMRENVTKITEKYIADGIKAYKKLSEGDKLKAFDKVKVGGMSIFRKELKFALTGASLNALDMARSEVPAKKNTKLKDKDVDIPEDLLKSKIYKFQEFSKLPKHVRLLLARQNEFLVAKFTSDAIDRIQAQYLSTESSTQDPRVIEQDLANASKQFIDGGNIPRAAANASATMVNDARNTFFFDDDVVDSIHSFTFKNDNPKTAICKRLSSSGNNTFTVNDAEYLRHAPPLHHNCKSYLKANLVGKSEPDTNEFPALSQAEKDSITFKDDLTDLVRLGEMLR